MQGTDDIGPVAIAGDVEGGQLPRGWCLRGTSAVPFHRVVVQLQVGDFNDDDAEQPRGPSGSFTLVEPVTAALGTR